MSDDKQQKVLIEQTSKRLKVIRAVGMVLVVIAILIAGVTSDEHGPTTAGYVLGGVIGGAGVLTWIVGMAMSWWHHG